jgi:hypothetical protein
MRRLAAIERALERLFERPSAKLFRLRLQPIQVLRRVERAIEGERRTIGGRTVVPDQLEVHLNPADLAAFEGVAAAVAAELADGALAFARAHGYAVTERPRVTLRADPAIPAGDVRVGAAFGAGVPGGNSPEDGATRVYEAPRMEAPTAVLEVIATDGSTRRAPVDGRRLSIGRAPDTGLVLTDSRVSRHHARINVRHRALVFTDLDSMNGSRVNGVRVSEVALGEGDRIEIGETVIVVEAVAEDQLDSAPAAPEQAAG